MPDDISRYYSTANDNGQFGDYTISDREKGVLTQNSTHPESLQGVNEGPQSNYNAVSAIWDQITQNNRTAYKAFGLPPQFNKYSDPQYLEEIGVKIGRVYSSTYMVNPTILSLKPCGVKYNQVGSGKTEYDEFYANTLLDIVTSGGNNDLIELVKNNLFSDDSMSGVLYSTTSMVDEYLRCVNYNLRLLSVYMGLQNKLIPGAKDMGAKSVYGNYNWMNYQATRFATNGFDKHPDGQGLIETPIDIFLNDDATEYEDWFHFYCDVGTSSDEQISTSVTASMIESALNEGSLNELSRNLNFLTGGHVGNVDVEQSEERSQMLADINQVIDEARGSAGGWIAKLLKGATGYLDGARIAFPKIIEDCEYGKSLEVTCRFISPYGDPESIYLYTYVPLMHLLPFAVPGQYDGVSYSFPYICKATIPGFFQSEIAVITNLSIKRGGDEDLQWTTSGLATEITVTFTITPLITTLMLSQTRNPLNAAKNYALMEYLSNLGAIDITDPKNGFDLRLATWKVIFGSMVADIKSFRYIGAPEMMRLKGNLSSAQKQMLAALGAWRKSKLQNANEYVNTNNSKYTFSEFMSR